MDNKPKRGRKPKGKIVEFKKEITTNNSPIIVHLPINDFDKKNSVNETKKDEIIDDLNKKLLHLTNKLNDLDQVQNDSLIKVNESNKSICWWCKYPFNTEKVQLPENYHNGIFHCSGNFCSYNCAASYNISLNDENISLRKSLLHYHYKKTYNQHIKIKPAPSWKILKHMGGEVDIVDYRKNLISNTVNYMYIKPPMISRLAYIEKVNISKQNNKNDSEFVLKRKKPLKTNRYTLEDSMGLKKIVNTN